jgi:hypothetical protein
MCRLKQQKWNLLLKVNILQLFFSTTAVPFNVSILLLLKAVSCFPLSIRRVIFTDKIQLFSFFTAMSAHLKVNFLPIIFYSVLNKKISRKCLFSLFVSGGTNSGTCANGFGVCCVCKLKNWGKNESFLAL